MTPLETQRFAILGEPRPTTMAGSTAGNMSLSLQAVEAALEEPGAERT